jgi:Leucine-rich repeat (LRR) protein
VSGCTKLTSLSVYSNESLTAVDVSGLTALATLSVYENNLTSIDVTGLTALTELSAYHNNLSSIDVSGLTKLERLYVSENETLSEIKGLKDLATLTTLEAYKTSLTSIDVSGLTKLVRLNVSECEYLEEIDASGCTALNDVYGMNFYGSFNALKRLNLSGTAISSFWIASEDIESIDLSGCTALTSVDIYDKEKLTSVNVSGCTAMTSFYVYNCATLASVNLNGCTALTKANLYDCATLATFDLTGLSKLESLSCYHNESLTSLDVSGLGALTSLDAYENKLATLDLSNNKNLKNVDVKKNQLATLTLNNPVLETLDCSNNLLTALDVSNSSGLNSLDCSNNELTTLDVSKNTHLTGLNCENNHLTSLDLSHNEELYWGWNTQQKITIDLVTLSATEVGFMVDDTFDSENVIGLNVNYDPVEPKYVTVNGKRYFVVNGDASKAGDLKEKPIYYTYKTNKEGYNLDIYLTVNDIVKSETIIEMDENVSLKATYGDELAAPAVTVRAGYDGTLSYKSSNESVVKVAADGKLTVVGAGNAVITISGTETNYCLAPADVTYDVEIAKAAITPTVTIQDWTYSEKAKAPVVKGNSGNGKETITYKEKGAADDTYSSKVPTAAGEYTVKVVVAETGNYLGGEVTADFTIAAKALTEGMVADIEKQFYNGSDVEPKPVVKDGDKVLEEGTDYTIVYSDNKGPGTATATITGKGNYKGTIVKQFTVFNAIKGDANGDGTVNAADIVEVVNFIMGNPSEKFIMELANANGDDAVNAADIVAIVNIIMGN